MPLHSIVASVPASNSVQSPALFVEASVSCWRSRPDCIKLSVSTFPCSITDKAIVLVLGLLDRITATRLAGGFGET